MELRKEMVHVLQIKSRATNQLTLDEDYNLPETKADIGRMIQSKGEVQVDEIKTGDGNASIAGKLMVDLLYVGEDKGGEVHSSTAVLDFQTDMYLDKVQSGDKLTLNWEIEDLAVHVINSRKINMKGILTFYGVVDEPGEVGIPMEVSDSSVSQKRKSIRLLSLVVHKKDTMRIKEELALSSNKPNILQILWNTVEVRGLDFRCLENQLEVKGELFIFVLYYGEGEDNPLSWLEYAVPFHGEVDCPGCTMEMIPDAEAVMVHPVLEVHPDSDGEERILQLEATLELNVKIYEEREYSFIEDVYTPLRQLIPERNPCVLDRLLVRNYSKCKISEKIQVSQVGEKVLSICHSHGTVKIDESKIVKDGIYVEGVIQLKILYIVSDDQMPFYSTEAMIPFGHRVEAQGIDDHCVYHLRPDLEQLSTTMLDGNEIEVKATLDLNAMVICHSQEALMEGVLEEPLPVEKIKNLPGIIIYVVQPKDTMWDIAKKFYTTVEDIMELNHMEQEQVSPYEPLLLVKKVEK